MDLDFKKLRQRGMLATTASGEEAVELTAKSNERLRHLSRQDRLETLHHWERDLSKVVEGHDGTVVPESLSLLGQYVRIVLPLRTFDKAVADLNRKDVRVDMVDRKLSLPSG